MKRFTVYCSFVVLFFCVTGCLKQHNHDSKIPSDIEQVFYKAHKDFLFQSSPDSALTIAKLASQYGLGNKNYNLAFDAILMSAYVYNEKRKRDSVKALMNTLIPLARQQKDSIHLAEAYKYLSNVYKEENQPDSSLFFLQIGLRYAKSKNNPTLSGLYIEKAEYMHRYNQFDSAHIYYIQALEQYEKEKHYANVANIYNRLSNLFADQKLPEEAKKYLQLSIHLNDSLGNIAGLSDNYNNLGILMKDNNQLDSAAFFLEKAISINQKTGDKYGEIATIYNLGNVYFAMEDYYNAKLSYSKVYEYCQKEQMPSGMVRALSGMAEIEDYNNNRDSAFVLLTKALNLARQINEPQGEVSILYQIVGLNFSRSVDSLNYLKQYRDLSDSLYNADYLAKLAENDVKYKTELKNKSIEILENKSKQQKLLASVFIGGFILALLLVLFILRSLALKRKANKMLAAQKEEIASQAEQLKDTNEKLVELDQFKQGMTSMIVHDLKNPLNTILNVSEKEPEREIKRSRQAASQMLNMVLNILDVNKYEYSEMTIRKTGFSIFNNAQKSIGQISFLAGQKNILIENNIDTLIGVLGEAEIIERVFINLLSNAIKYTPVNGKIELSSQIDKKEEQVVLSVKDTGQGISKEYHEKVFEKFTQIEAKSSGGVHSTGLGLTFCRMAVEAHGGKIWIDDNYTGGTSILFTLHISTLYYQEEETPSPPTENISLSEQEKMELKKYLPKFEQLEIYEISSFRKLFRDIEHEKVINERWLQQLRNAVEHGNQKRFDFLLSFVKN